MGSLLTNESAMVALNTLRTINSNLASVQKEVSTGKSIANARDNAAIWAVSTVMQSDVDGFKAISDSLNLGASTVAVARTASEQVTDLLTEIKGLVVAAQEENVDRSKIQTDIDNLRDQVSSIVDAASFNGLNLVKGSGTIDVLSSLDRDGSTVSPSTINIARQNLETTGGTFVGGDDAALTVAVSGATIADAASETLTLTTTAALTAGSGVSIEVGTSTFEYIVGDNDTINEAVESLAQQINDAGISGVTASFSTAADPDAGAATVVVSNASGTGNAVAFTATEGAGGTAGGGLGDLAGINVDTTDSTVLTDALDDIESLIQVGIDAAAEFGSAQKRIEIQEEFVTDLMDALKTGIGALTDADLEEASARLQSLQVQQQLGIQALTIANQQPQSLLGLFR
ncbi:MAG: flagellin [Pseudomonadota bacterium]